VGARISDETLEALIASVDASLLAVDHDGVGNGQVERPDLCASSQRKEPGFSLRLEAPMGAGREIDPLEHEVRIHDQEGPVVGEPDWRRSCFRGTGVCNRNGVGDVKFAPASVVKHAKRRVAPLLDLGDRESRSDGVDRSSRHEYDVVLNNGTPVDQVGD